jgi:PKD repeat protein
MTASSTRRFATISAVLVLAFSLVLTAALPLAPSHRLAESVSSVAGSRRIRALSVEAQAVISNALGVDQARFQARRTSRGYRLGGGGLRMELSRGGVRMSTGERSLSMEFSAIGRGKHLLPVSLGSPHARANRVFYSHAGIQESYAAGPLGIEQGFTLARRAAGKGPLTLALSLRGSLHGVRSGSQVEFVGATGQPRLHYSGLSAIDAAGRHLPAWLEVSGGRLLVRVADAGARYPVRIDPLIEQGEALTPNEDSSYSQFGYSVALSADGDTALVGARGVSSRVGEAWVFIRSGSTWTQQGAKLTGTGEIGKGEFGSSVALSADGDTALIGAPGENGNVGGAWVFTRSGSTWTQHGGKLTGGGEVGEGQFGASVALSADSLTALIGGPYDDGSAGSAWIFTRSGATWTQQGEKLAANDESGLQESLLGWSVALSADGNTALIGGWGDNHFTGAAWVFTRSGSTWTQQGAKLTVSTGPQPWFGYRVALSADGDTALIGAPSDVGESGEGNPGAAWVFTRSGSTWTQGEKLSPPRENLSPEFGYGVALSANGDTALIGGPTDGPGYGTGSAWVFTRSGSTWTQQGAKITGITNSTTVNFFGINVALSADGETALIGGPFTNSGTGGAWVFVASPQISSPASLSFGPQTVGRSGPVLWLEVKNTGAAPLAGLTFSGPAQTTGPDASEFTIPSGDDLCDGETLQPGQACRIGVQFTAASTGTSSATLSFGANNSLSAAPTVALSGTGVQSPSAAFTSPENAIAGAPITFNASASSAPDGTIEHYAWSFGDGTTAEGVTPRHTYAAPGTYVVTLTVTDNDGLTSHTMHSMIAREAQTIELLSSAPASATVGDPSYVVSAVASSGLPVSFTSETPEACRVQGATVSFIAPGGCTIDASQPGDTEYGPAPEARQSFAIGKGTQLIRFTSSLPASATVGGPPWTVSATASSGLDISLTADTPNVCTLEGATVRFIAAGTCTIDANQPGNPDYDAAPQAQQSIVARYPAVSHATPAPASSSGFSLVGTPAGNAKTGAITFTVSVAQPGRLSWLLTFPNGKFGAFSASKTKCKTGQIKLDDKCRLAEIIFGEGSTTIAAAGTTSFVVTPSASGKTALENALKKGRGVPVRAILTYQSSLHGTPVAHTQAITDTLKNPSKSKR